MPSSKQDEARIQQLLWSRQLRAERLPRDHTSREPEKPDFRILGPNDEFFFCEVKSIFTQTRRGGLLHRTIHNGLTAKFHKAAAQFRTVNSNHFVPNVLVWVSHNIQINVHTFRDLLHGKIVIGGLFIADLSRYRYGQLRSDLGEIDLHVWLEPDDTPQWVLNPVRREFTGRLMRLFNIDDANVRPL